MRCHRDFKGRGLIGAQPNADGCELDEGQIVGCQLVYRVATRRHGLILLKNCSIKLRARYRYGLKQTGSLQHKVSKKHHPGGYAAPGISSALLSRGYSMSNSDSHAERANARRHISWQDSKWEDAHFLGAAAPGWFVRHRWRQANRGCGPLCRILVSRCWSPTTPPLK
jgi:hypothetical protein